MTRTFSSRWVVVAMASLALAAVVGSQMYYKHIQQKSLALWGSAAASAIVNAPRAVALRLGKPGEMSTAGTIETIHVGGLRRSVLERHVVSEAPGFSHVRASLVNDFSYDWNASANDCEPEWQYGLEFSAGEASTILLLFAPNCQRVDLPLTGASAKLRTMDVIERFMGEQFNDPRP